MNNVNIVNTEATQAIVDAVVKANFVALDDHRMTGENEMKLGGVAVHVRRDGKQTVVALFTKEFSDYYSMNQVVVDSDGYVHVTRNAVAGIITDATDDVVADVKRNREGYNWELIAERPALHPGHLVNVVAAK